MVLSQKADGRVMAGLSGELVDVQNQILTAGMIAQSVDPDEVKELLDAYGKLEAVGPLFDPSAFMGNTFNLIRSRAKIAGTFLAFREAVIEGLKEAGIERDV